MPNFVTAFSALSGFNIFREANKYKHMQRQDVIIVSIEIANLQKYMIIASNNENIFRLIPLNSNDWLFPFISNSRSQMVFSSVKRFIVPLSSFVMDPFSAIRCFVAFSAPNHHLVVNSLFSKWILGSQQIKDSRMISLTSCIHLLIWRQWHFHTRFLRSLRLGLQSPAIFFGYLPAEVLLSCLVNSRNRLKS